MGELIDGHIADLALLVRVHDLGGFTAAARATGRPQGTVSRRIAKLEKHFGVRLLDRTTRCVALTEAGKHIYERARHA
jgi:DNA-binding transcriptional LysR family regulator